MTDHKKPGVVFWATVVIVLVLAYRLSIGPVVWLDEHGFLPDWTGPGFRAVYVPLNSLRELLPWLDDALLWYANLWR